MICSSSQMYSSDLFQGFGIGKWLDFPISSKFATKFLCRSYFPFSRHFRKKTMKIKASYFATYLFAEEGLETDLFALVRHVGGISTRDYPQGRHFDGHLVKEQKVGGVFRRKVEGQDYRDPEQFAKTKSQHPKAVCFHKISLTSFKNQTSQTITFVGSYLKAMFLVAQQIHSRVMWYTSEAMESDRFEVLNCKGVPFSMRVRPVGGERQGRNGWGRCAHKLVGERIMLSIFLLLWWGRD